MRRLLDISVWVALASLLAVVSVVLNLGSVLVFALACGVTLIALGL